MKKTKSGWAKATAGATASKEAMQNRIKVLDGYHTPRIAVEKLIAREEFSKRVWEPANGFHRISRVLERNNFKVCTSDIYRWTKRTQVKKSFFDFKKAPRNTDIITNPPFILAQQFVEHAMKILEPNRKLALLLRLAFLESNKRYFLFKKYPPKYVYIFSFRLPRMHQFKHKGKKSSSLIAFAWFVWEKGNKEEPKIRFINKD